MLAAHWNLWRDSMVSVMRGWKNENPRDLLGTLSFINQECTSHIPTFPNGMLNQTNAREQQKSSSPASVLWHTPRGDFPTHSFKKKPPLLPQYLEVACFTAYTVRTWFLICNLVIFTANWTDFFRSFSQWIRRTINHCAPDYNFSLTRIFFLTLFSIYNKSNTFGSIYCHVGLLCIPLPLGQVTIKQFLLSKWF